MAKISHLGKVIINASYSDMRCFFVKMVSAVMATDITEH